MALTLLWLAASLAAVAQLFVSLSLVSSAFLAPALTALTDALALDESTAGVTLLALGNAAPDAAGALAAVRRGAAQLALGELLGAAAFVSTFVAGIVMLAACRPVSQSRPESSGRLALPRRSSARDIVSLILGVLGALTGIIYFSGFNRRACLAFLVLYALYALDVLAPPVGLRYFFRNSSATGPIHLPWGDDATHAGRNHDDGLPTPVSSGGVSPSSTDSDGHSDAHHHAMALGAPHSLLAALEFRDVVAHLDADAVQSRANAHVRALAFDSPEHDAVATDLSRPALVRFVSESALEQPPPHHLPSWSDQAYRDADPADYLSDISSRRASAESVLSAPAVPVSTLPLPSTSAETESTPLSRAASTHSQSSRHPYWLHWRTFRLALLPAWPVIRGRGGDSLSTRVLALLSTPPLFLFLLTIPIPHEVTEDDLAPEDVPESDGLATAAQDRIQSSGRQPKTRDPAALARARAAARAAARAKILPPLHAGLVPGFILWSLWPRAGETPSATWETSFAPRSLFSGGLVEKWQNVIQCLSPTQAALIFTALGWVLYGIRRTGIACWYRSSIFLGSDETAQGDSGPSSQRFPAGRRRDRNGGRRGLSTDASTHSLHNIGSEEGNNATLFAGIVQPGLEPVASPPEYDSLPISQRLDGAGLHPNEAAAHEARPRIRKFINGWRELAPLTLAFATSVLWITTTVDWLVDLLEALGETLDISEAGASSPFSALGLLTQCTSSIETHAATHTLQTIHSSWSNDLRLRKLSRRFGGQLGPCPGPPTHGIGSVLCYSPTQFDPWCRTGGILDLVRPSTWRR